MISEADLGDVSHLFDISFADETARDDVSISLKPFKLMLAEQR